MEIVRVTIRLRRSEDAALVRAIEALPTGERNKALKRALENSLIHGPNLAQAIDALALAVRGLQVSSPAESPHAAAKPKPDMAALKASLLDPFKAKKE